MKIIFIAAFLFFFFHNNFNAQDISLQKSQINLLDNKIFEDEILDMNDDVMEKFYGPLNPKHLIVSLDNKYMYFTSEPYVDASKRAKYTAYDVSDEFKKHEKVYRGTIGFKGMFSKTELSSNNLDDDISTASALIAISQDNNAMYINAMDAKELNVYRIHTTKDKEGYSVYHKNKLKFKGYENNSNYLDDIMSYDGNYYIVSMRKEKAQNDEYERDMYVAIKKKEDEYAEFIHLGFDINTNGDEHPCYLAPDNKTLYFASDGLPGYGLKDIFMTRRLDDTWQHWSEPVNIGAPINTEKYENFFTIGPRAEYAYFVRWENNLSDIFRVKFSTGEKEEMTEKTIKPEPVVIISGITYNKKDNSFIQAEINYYNIDSSNLLGTAVSSEKDGRYTIALPMGHKYSYEAKADDFISISENIEVKDLQKVSEITKNLYLVPIGKGETILLNNIFFETAKATLKSESTLELEKLLKILTENPKMKIEISGHTDNVGEDAYNLELSQKRAQTVVDWLIEKEISEKRIRAKGYGETKPVASNDNENGRILNRRVEFTILN